MNFTEFVAMMQEKLCLRLGSSCQISMTDITKNNQTTHSALTIRTEGHQLSPVIYMEPLFRDYQNGTSPDTLVENILQMLDLPSPDALQIAGHLEAYETARPFIGCKLINKEQNRDVLQHTPYRDFMDLAMVPVYLQPQREDACLSSAVITKNLIEHWKIDEETVLDNAIAQTPLLMPAELCSLSELLVKSGLPQYNVDTPLMIVTNTARHFGAICITYPHVIREYAASVQSNVYMIPSSIHEVLLIPKNHMPASALNQMIRDVNRDCVPPEAFLSDHAYEYDYRKDQWLDVT